MDGICSSRPVHWLFFVAGKTCRLSCVQSLESLKGIVRIIFTMGDGSHYCSGSQWDLNGVVLILNSQTCHSFQMSAVYDLNVSSVHQINRKTYGWMDG